MKPTCFDKLLVRCRRESWRGIIRIVSFFIPSLALPIKGERGEGLFNINTT